MDGINVDDVLISTNLGQAIDDCDDAFDIDQLDRFINGQFTDQQQMFLTDGDDDVILPGQLLSHNERASACQHPSTRLDAAAPLPQPPPGVAGHQVAAAYTVGLPPADRRTAENVPPDCAAEIGLDWIQQLLAGNGGVALPPSSRSATDGCFRSVAADVGQPTLTAEDYLFAPVTASHPGYPCQPAATAAAGAAATVDNMHRFSGLTLADLLRETIVDCSSGVVTNDADRGRVAPQYVQPASTSLQSSFGVNQQIAFPYTPPESGSEVNSPPYSADSPYSSDVTTAYVQVIDPAHLLEFRKNLSPYHATSSQQLRVAAQNTPVSAPLAPPPVCTLAAVQTSPGVQQQKKAETTKPNNSRMKPTNSRGVRQSPATKKRKYSDSSSGTVNTVNPEEIKNESVYVSDDSEDDAAGGSSVVHRVKWCNYQQTKWAKLFDSTTHELPPVIFNVDADKGFLYLPHDESFVCQKKNHFQVTVRAGLGQRSKVPQYVQDLSTGSMIPVDGFYLHFSGIKMELPSYKIKIEQSHADRSKHPLAPVRVELTAQDSTKTVVGRLHFSETTLNNMRKRGKPNPDQRYFQLVVSLFAHRGDAQYLVAAQISDRIIVRASNPGQFDGETELSWMRGKISDSVYHMGNVGINTDCTEEALTVHGNIQVSGKVLSPSDVRAKTDIEEMDSSSQLQNIAKLKVYSYRFTNEFAEYAGLPPYAVTDTGVLAQEVHEVIPDAVCHTGDVVLPNGEIIEDLLIVNKDRIFFENIGAVKELCKVTDNLEMRINEIEIVNRKLAKLGRAGSSKSTRSTTSIVITEASFEVQECKKPIPADQNASETSTAVAPTAGTQPDVQVTSKSSKGCFKSRVSQITSIILVVIMAMCVTAVTTLYVLDKQEKSSQTTTSSLFTNGTLGNQTHPVTDESPQLQTPLTLPSCLRSACPVVCCPPASVSSTTSAASHYLPDPTAAETPTSPTAAGTLSNTTTPTTSYNTSAEQAVLTPLSSVDTTSVTSVAALLTSASTMESFITASAKTAMTELLVNSNSTLEPTGASHVVKRDTGTELPLANIFIVEVNQTLSTAYCLNTECRQQFGGNYSYLIPINSTFPMMSLTVHFLPISSVDELRAYMCNEAHSAYCGSSSDNATQTDLMKWILPVGYHYSSEYIFRITSGMATSSPCSSPFGDVFTEYTLYFERVCSTT